MLLQMILNRQRRAVIEQQKNDDYQSHYAHFLSSLAASDSIYFHSVML
jgi:hypothetical protein